MWIYIGDRITDEVFRCFPDSPHAVTYRALLHGTTSANSSELISHIEQWMTEGAIIMVQRVLMTIVYIMVRIKLVVGLE